jgi:hypothetical protein
MGISPKSQAKVDPIPPIPLPPCQAHYRFLTQLWRVLVLLSRAGREARGAPD